MKYAHNLNSVGNKQLRHGYKSERHRSLDASQNIKAVGREHQMATLIKA